ncbi:hypothetical protein RCL_jg8560.t1 [Rhizophagus clarus]|uniref:Uncharacterized protein n=1 Tax=Rhizophagus clarus TaxID=94130 RepID=A0A8H3M3X2_9GLOM|nr:hypothetical protein RCL_jg8560.t1 [Rhizophagus clarus]
MIRIPSTKPTTKIQIDYCKYSSNKARQYTQIMDQANVMMSSYKTDAIQEPNFYKRLQGNNLFITRISFYQELELTIWLICNHQYLANQGSVVPSPERFSSSIASAPLRNVDIGGVPDFRN